MAVEPPPKVYLRDFLVDKRLIGHRDQEMMHCCFHVGDNSPSMQLHRNHGWCYACNRKYTYVDFGRHFHVWLDWEPPGENEKDIGANVYYGEKKDIAMPKHSVLFDYPFIIQPLPVRKSANS